jgi:hypothetical protein
MRIPEFTSEASLYRSIGQYTMRWAPGVSTNQVVPQLMTTCR